MKCNSVLDSKLAMKRLKCQLDKHDLVDKNGSPIAHEYKKHELLTLWVKGKYIQLVDARGAEEEWGELAILPYD